MYGRYIQQHPTYRTIVYRTNVKITVAMRRRGQCVLLTFQFVRRNNFATEASDPSLLCKAIRFTTGSQQYRIAASCVFFGAIDVGITCPSVHRPSFILNASVKRVVAFQQSTGVVESNYMWNSKPPKWRYVQLKLLNTSNKTLSEVCAIARYNQRILLHRR